MLRCLARSMMIMAGREGLLASVDAARLLSGEAQIQEQSGQKGADKSLSHPLGYSLGPESGRRPAWPVQRDQDENGQANPDQLREDAHPRM